MWAVLVDLAAMEVVVVRVVGLKDVPIGIARPGASEIGMVKEDSSEGNGDR